MRQNVSGLLAAGIIYVLTSTGAQAADPASTCEAGKNGTAGKYGSCLHKAQAKFVKGGGVDTAARDAALLKCAEKYSGKWAKTEDKAGGACPSNGDESGIQDFLDACATSVEDALAGGTLPLDVVTCNDDLGTCNTNLTTCSGDLSSTNADLGTCNGDLTACSSDLGSCQSDLSDCLAIPPAQPLKTGQTVCYNFAGAVIACAGTGQDGNLQKGVARSFTDNGDGTITDNATGLMWEKLSNDGSIHHVYDTYLWTDAFAPKIATLNSAGFAGYSDWRVPNSFELFTLLHHGALNPATYSVFDTPCPAACTVLTCSCTFPGAYWSSTTYQGSPSLAWLVDFVPGNMTPAAKANSYYVRAVRGGS